MNTKNLLLSVAVAIVASFSSFAAYESAPELRFPYVSTYYYDPTVSPDVDMVIPFYCSDWDHSLVRFGDGSKRFNAYLKYTTDLVNWTELHLDNIPSGDHQFNLGHLPVGDYTYALRVVELGSGLSSHTVYRKFRSRTTESMTTPSDKVYTMTEADLTNYGITPETGRFSFNIVNFTDEEHESVKNVAKADTAPFLDLMDSKLEGVVPPSGTYAIYAPAYTNKLYFQGWRRSRVLYAPDYDFAAVDSEATNNVVGIQRLIDDVVAAGYRKLVLLPYIYRIPGLKTLYMRSNLTLDLNGATIKCNRFLGRSATMIAFDNVHDAVLVNGTIDGDYYEHDYTGADPEWPLGIKMQGYCSYCAVDGVRISNITGYGLSTGFGGSAGQCFPGSSGASFRGSGCYEPGSLNLADGTIDLSISNSFTSVYRDISKFTNHFITVSKHLGYQDIRTRSWYYKAAFYDANKTFISGEVAFQYHDVLIPAGTKYMRISIDETSVGKAEGCELTGQLVTIPWNNAFRNMEICRCRCVGMAPAAMYHQLFDGCEFSFCGDSQATCAFDAEDGWDQMQDVFMRNNYFHDNNNAELVFCAGHNFVLDNNRANISQRHRAVSPCIRSNVCNYANFDCLDNRNRAMCARYIGNKFRDSVSLGGSTDDIGWDVVMSEPIKSSVPGRQFSFTPYKSGRLLNTYLDNVKVTGGAGDFDGIAFSNCYFVMTFTKYNFNNCEIVGTRMHYPNVLNTFRNCTFRDSYFDGMSGGTLNIYDSYFENSYAKMTYWTKPYTLNFQNITVRNDNRVFWDVPAYSVGKIAVFNSDIDTGTSAAFYLSDLRAQDTDVQTGKVNFVETKFSSAPAVKLNGSTSAKRIEFASYACKIGDDVIATTNQFITSLPSPWTLYLSEEYAADPELEPEPAAGQLTTNAMANASWGYIVKGLGMLRDNTACVFTNTTAAMNWTVPEGVTNIYLLVVAGGGAGGNSSAGGYDRAAGGGGGGGVQYRKEYVVTPGADFAVSVGAGGVESNGGDTSFGTILAHGGGLGGSFSAGFAGGCGGGGSCGPNKIDGFPGGLSTAEGLELGNAGGIGLPDDESSHIGYGAGGGGGGAGGAGVDAESNDDGGRGGAGKSYSLLGYPVVYSSGGGGGSTSKSPVGAGGIGAGNGGNQNVDAGNATGIGCGGGGAGGCFGRVENGAIQHGGNGADGIVIIRYVGGDVPPVVDPLDPPEIDYSEPFGTNAMSSASWGYEIHGLGIKSNEVALVFTNTTEEMSWTIPDGVSKIRYLVVGGGASGSAMAAANNIAGGGGGAGGMLFASGYSVSASESVVITVGHGGAAVSTEDTSRKNGNSGTASVLTIGESEILAHGGGYGGTQNGAKGGSGGGAGDLNNGAHNGGAAYDGEGYPGGGASTGTGGGGGGGAGGAGATATGSTGGKGGDGLQNDITGENCWYAAGGGGGGKNSSNGGAGGIGGGGAGNTYSSGSATVSGSGTTYGSGGGGTQGNQWKRHTSGAGKQGVVIIRYTRGGAAPAAKEVVPGTDAELSAATLADAEAEAAEFAPVIADSEAAAAGQASIVKVMVVEKDGKYYATVAIDETKVLSPNVALIDLGESVSDVVEANVGDDVEISVSGTKVTPGLYYSIISDTVLNGQFLSEGARVLATGSGLKLKVKRPSGGTAFFKIRASLTAE